MRRHAPLNQMQRHSNKHGSHPLSIEEQGLLFSTSMVIWRRWCEVNTLLRDQDVVNLRCSWDAQAPEFDTTALVIPGSYAKNCLHRFVVLNRVAESGSMVAEQSIREGRASLSTLRKTYTAGVTQRSRTDLVRDRAEAASA